MSSAGHNFSQPQQTRSGCFGFRGKFTVGFSIIIDELIANPLLAPTEKSRKSSSWSRAGWGILAFLAVETGLVSLRYALPHPPFPAELPNFHERHGWLIAHAIFSSIALLAGPWQFVSSLRRRSLAVHRWTGWIYCATVAAGWLASLPIAAHAQTGRVASAGFLTLGVVWISTTAAGYFAMRRRDIRAHREWMMRSYAATAAAVTLRLYLPIVFVAKMPFDVGYPVIAWVCWVPNLVFVEWLIRRRRERSAGLVVGSILR